MLHKHLFALQLLHGLLQSAHPLLIVAAFLTIFLIIRVIISLPLEHGLPLPLHVLLLQLKVDLQSLNDEVRRVGVVKGRDGLNGLGDVSGEGLQGGKVEPDQLQDGNPV